MWDSIERSRSGYTDMPTLNEYEEALRARVGAAIDATVAQQGVNFMTPQAQLNYLNNWVLSETIATRLAIQDLMEHFGFLVDLGGLPSEGPTPDDGGDPPLIN